VQNRVNRTVRVQVSPPRSESLAVRTRVNALVAMSPPRRVSVAVRSIVGAVVAASAPSSVSVAVRVSASVYGPVSDSHE